MNSVKIEPMEAPMTCKSIKGTLTADDGPAFRWWTCGVLMFYSASLLVFCGLVTLQKDHPADGLKSESAAADPRPPSVAICTVADPGLSGYQTRTLCHLVD